MKAVAILLISCVGVALAGSFVNYPYGEKVADQDFLHRQKKVLELLNHVTQAKVDGEYVQVAKEYNLKDNFNNYNNVEAVKEFDYLYQKGMLPKGEIFSVFYDQMREEAIALFHLFFYAKDFETFYKSAAWARYHLNDGMFVYAYTIAVLHREDCRGIVLPAPYEIYPHYFVNAELLQKFYLEKMVNGQVDPKIAEYYGVTYADNVYTFYANYTGWYTRYNEEQQLSYFTEDIGLNSYYYYFHADYPFWMGGEDYDLYKDRRGELYYYFHQQLLARYYMERLTNGVGEIPKFSWKMPIKTGYNPSLKYHLGYNFPARDNNYQIVNEENIYDLEFVEHFEEMFHGFIDFGRFKTHSQKGYDLTTPQAIETLGNMFQYNPDLFDGKYETDYVKYYEIIARILLGTSKDPLNKYNVGPSALEQFETSLRDPMFWQLYKRVIHYFLIFKRHLAPYTKEELMFDGVKIENVVVDKLVTFYDYYEYDATNAVFLTKEEMLKQPFRFQVRQPRLNHKGFAINIDVNSVKDVDCVVRIFMGPKYDSYGKHMSYDENKYNFFELDTFLYKLTAGKNAIIRKAEDFFRVSKDRTSAFDLRKKIEAALSGSDKFSLDMSEAHNGFPYRMLLPKGTKGGFPFQFYVIVSPVIAPEVIYGTDYEESYYSGVGTGARYLDGRALGYPFDRPIDETYFYQPNMYFADVNVYHYDDEYVYNYATPGYYAHQYKKNVV